MKTIGWIVVIALIVYCAVKCCQNKSQDKKEQEDQDPEPGSSGGTINPIDALLNKPIVQEKISQVEKVIAEKIDELKQGIPVLTSSVPVEKKIVIAEPIPVNLPVTPGSEDKLPLMTIKQFKSLVE